MHGVIGVTFVYLSGVIHLVGWYLIVTGEVLQYMFHLLSSAHQV